MVPALYMEDAMRHVALHLSCAATIALFAPLAQAVTCDIVFDRTGTLIYQDTMPPVDLSERGAAAREKMRERGELLMIIESSQCPRLVFSSVTGAASVDEIVSGMQPYIAVTGGMGSTALPGGGKPATAPAPTAPAARNSGAPGRY